MGKPPKIEIARRTVVFTTFFLLGLYLLWIIRELLYSLFIAFMVMSIVKPVVARLTRYKIPKALSTLIIFILLFSIVGYGISAFLPSFLSDMSELLRNFSVLIQDLDPNLRQFINGKTIESYLPNATQQVLPFIRNVFSNVVFVLTTLFFSFYFVIEEDFLKKILLRFFKEHDAHRVAQIVDKMEARIGSWFYGQIILMAIIGILTYIGLSFIGVKHALSLAVIAGILEAFPVVGPVISAIPAFIFAVNQELTLGIYTLILYIAVQQIENNLLVPAVMRRAAGLDRVLILIVLVISGKLGGFLGLFIAIPLTLCIETILLETRRKR